MSDIKYIYFDLRVKGEPARLLLAHGGVKYTDERIELGWNDPKPWTELKPSMPWGQLPMLQWKGESICQSMAICRFLAREFGIAGKTSLEMAQVPLFFSKSPKLESMSRWTRLWMLSKMA